jgi:hypothetical protein
VSDNVSWDILRLKVGTIDAPCCLLLTWSIDEVLIPQRDVCHLPIRKVQDIALSSCSGIQIRSLVHFDRRIISQSQAHCRGHCRLSRSRCLCGRQLASNGRRNGGSNGSKSNGRLVADLVLLGVQPRSRKGKLSQEKRRSE